MQARVEKLYSSLYQTHIIQEFSILALHRTTYIHTTQYTNTTTVYGFLGHIEQVACTAGTYEDISAAATIASARSHLLAPTPGTRSRCILPLSLPRATRAPIPPIGYIPCILLYPSRRRGPSCRWRRRARRRRGIRRRV